MENGYRKSQDGMANKVSIKVESVKITLLSLYILIWATNLILSIHFLYSF